MDVTEAVLPPGLANDVEPSKVDVSGHGVLFVVDELRKDKFVLFSVVDRGAPVDVLDGIEAIAETSPRFINVSFSQQEVLLFLSWQHQLCCPHEETYCGILSSKGGPTLSLLAHLAFI